MQGGDQIVEKAAEISEILKHLKCKCLVRTDEYKLGKLTQATAMTVFSFMTIEELINKVSKINQKIRMWLVEPGLQKKFLV